MPRRLNNEALRLPKPSQEASWTTKGPLGVLRGWFGGSPGVLLGHSWSLLGLSGERFGVLLGPLGEHFDRSFLKR